MPPGPLPDWVACVWLPYFTVHAERARRPELAGQPFVLLTGNGRSNQAILRACSPEARAAGLAVGAAASTVSQRCPGALLLPFDPFHYQQRYERLLNAFDVITPLIEGDPFEVYYLDLTGLPHLDAEQPEQVFAAVRALVPPPFSPRLGLSSGKFTAWVAATRATAVRPVTVTDGEKREFLREAPTTLLPAEFDVLRQLDRMGLRTLGRIAELPRTAMLARFGWPGEKLHRLVCGEDREPLAPYRAVPLIRETWTFSYVPTTEHFLMALERLVRRAWARKERNGRGVRQVRLEARLEIGNAWERHLTLRKPMEQPEPAYAELKRRLEGCLPEGPVTELLLELAALAPRLEGQQLLFREETVERLERLRAELDHAQTRGRLRGRPAAYRIVEVDPWSLLPEELHALVPYDR